MRFIALSAVLLALFLAASIQATPEDDLVDVTRAEDSFNDDTG